MAEAGWKFGFGPHEAESAWRCQRCRTIMLRNVRRCPTCLFTIYDPVHRRAQPTVEETTGDTEK